MKSNGEEMSIYIIKYQLITIGVDITIHEQLNVSVIMQVL